MANSNRRVINKNGQMFIPMNVDGGYLEEQFFNSTKLVITIVLVIFNILVLLWVKGLSSGWVLKNIMYVGIIYVNQMLIRRYLFDEKYYFKIYQKMKNNSVTTPGIFWDIASIQNTEEGAIITYSDLKTALIIRLERDTITGKNAEFEEIHYDALSDFYKEIGSKGYKFVQLNIMEQAGKDPRLKALDELAIKSDNTNIKSIIEMQIGYIKNITRSTLFESDYILIYSEEISKKETIISDSIDCVYTLLKGAFIGFHVLNSREISDLVKEIYGVKYFDTTESTINMFNNNGINIGKTFKIKQIDFITKESEQIGERELNRLNTLASYISNNDINYGEWTIKEAIKGKIKSSKNSSGKAENENGAGNVIDYLDLDNYAFGLVQREEKNEKNKIEKRDIHLRGHKDKKVNNKGVKNQQNTNKNAKRIIEQEDKDEIIDF